MQLTFEGKTKEQVAIERLRQYEPLEGYYLACSGGKDSVALKKLAVLSEVKFDAHYSVTCIDPPELIYFLRKYHPDVVFEKPEMSIWRWIEKKGLPTRLNRWCCEVLKENGGKGRIVLTGVRWEESNKRKTRPMYGEYKGKITLNPIIDWTTADVWDFIDTYKLPYCSLYDNFADRIGCIGCPNSNRYYAFRKYPKIAEAWHRAALRYWDAEHDRQKQTYRLLQDGEQFWQWWLSGKSIKKFLKENQPKLFK